MASKAHGRGGRTVPRRAHRPAKAAIERAPWGPHRACLRCRATRAASMRPRAGQPGRFGRAGDRGASARGRSALRARGGRQDAAFAGGGAARPWAAAAIAKDLADPNSAGALRTAGARPSKRSGATRTPWRLTARPSVSSRTSAASFARSGSARVTSKTSTRSTSRSCSCCSGSVGPRKPSPTRRNSAPVTTSTG